MRQHACSFTPASSGCSASLTVTSINFWELHQHVVYAMTSCQQRGPTCKSAGTQEGRWPMQLQLQLRFMGPGVNSDRLWARTTAFPAPTLAHAPSFSAAPILQVAGQLSSLGTSAANGSKSTSGNSPRSDRTAGAIPTAAARSSSPALIQNSRVCSRRKLCERAQQIRCCGGGATRRRSGGSSARQCDGIVPHLLSAAAALSQARGGEMPVLCTLVCTCDAPVTACAPSNLHASKFHSSSVVKT